MKLVYLSLLACLGLPLPRLLAPAQAQAEPTGAVRLVLVLNVDSMIPEQLGRLDAWWKGGFRRLIDQGARFVEAKLPYANTESAVGHASFATGCLPSHHGITRDVLIDSGSARLIPCVHDESVSTVSSSAWKVAEQGSASGQRLLRPGWAEALRARWPGSRSISISGKGTSAVLLAGQQPQLAVWWDSYGRGFISSTAYVEELPPWLATWNGNWPAEARGWSWEANLPVDPAQSRTAADDRKGEAAVGGQAPVFPYRALELPVRLDARAQAALAGRVFVTPLMDRFVCELALKAVIGADLGADEEVDLLAISLSSCDLLGKATGPYSLEVTDALLRADEALGVLFAALDEQLGASHWMVAMSSDHGLLELPEGDARQSNGGVRLRVRARRQALQLLRSSLQAKFGQDFGANLIATGDAVSFAPGALEGDQVDARQVRELAAKVLKQMPWIADTYTRDALMAPAAETDGHWLRLARNSFRVAGGVEVEIRMAHRHLLGRQTGTQSGSPYSYDRRQSLILMGPGIEAGEYRGPASSIDALPTLLGRLGLPAGASVDGRDLLED